MGFGSITKKNDTFTAFRYKIVAASASARRFFVHGDQTHDFKQGDSIQISATAYNNGLYTVVSTSFDTTANRTRIGVAEPISASAAEGIIDLTTKEIPWQTGDVVVVNSTKFLPTPLYPNTPYYVIRKSNTRFSLAETKNNAEDGIAITFTTNGDGFLSVAEVASSFRVFGGNGNSGEVWFHLALDKNDVRSFSPPQTLLGMQNFVNLMDGYASYQQDSGLIQNVSESNDFDPVTGRLINWQLETERFMDWAFGLRSTRLVVSDTYQISASPSTDILTFASAVPMWLSGTAVSITSSGALPSPLISGAKYYVVLTGTPGQIKLSTSPTVSDPSDYVDITTGGSGTVEIGLYDKQRAFPRFELNPARNNVWIDTPQGVLSDVITGPYSDIRIQQSIFDQYNRPVSSNDLTVYREDKRSHIAMRQEIANDVDPIYANDPYNYIHFGGAHLFVEGYEHFLLLNNYAVSGALLYDAFLGLSTNKYNVDYYEKTDYTLRPTLGGYYLIDNTFQRNMEGAATDLQEMYDALALSEATTMAQHARSLVGYKGRMNFLDLLNVNSKSQFMFYRGMVQSKGSINSVKAYINSRRFVGAQLDEFWAWKLADFGDSRPKTYPELNLFLDDGRSDIRLEFLAPTEATTGSLSIVNEYAESAAKKFNLVSIKDTDRWFEYPDQKQRIESALFLDAEVSSMTSIFCDIAPPPSLHTQKIDFWFNTFSKQLFSFDSSLSTWSVDESERAVFKAGVVYFKLDTACDDVRIFQSVIADGNLNDFTNQQLRNGDATDPVESSFFTTTSIPRMTPKYFTVDGPRSMSFALTTNGSDLRVDYTSRMQDNLCGLIWSSEDTKDHTMLKYETKKDYRGMVWDFDLAVSNTAPLLNEPTKALSLTIEGRNAAGTPVSYIVPIFRYATTPASRASHITINFDTVQAGFSADIPVYAGDIDRMFISCITSSYAAGSVPLDAPEQGWLTLRNSRVSGGNSLMTVGIGSVPAHELGMSTSYDDHYDQSPERILDNIWSLGYRGWINHYAGMSVFPEKTWTGSRLEVVDPVNPDNLSVVNAATSAWHLDYATRCGQKKYKLIQAVSYETFSENARFEWTQRDFNDNFAQTGYTPPSYLLSPCNENAMAWLKAAFVAFATIANTAGIPIYMQVGEPWWWYNPDTQKPCIYDFPTRLKFNNETGLFAPEFTTINSTATGTPYDEFKAFLKKELGLSVQSMRTAVKAAFPSAQVSVLPFLPTIIGKGIMGEINLPTSHYAYPNFDFFQTEAYDYLIGTETGDISVAMTYPLDTLGYPPIQVQYLVGFAPETPANQRPIVWNRIFHNAYDNEVYKIAKQHVWAYTLVMRDNITYMEDGTLRGYFINGAYVQVSPAADFERLNAMTLALPIRTMDGILNVFTINPAASKISPACLLDKSSDTVLQSVPMWDPARGSHYPYALRSITLDGVSDPAHYTITLNGSQENLRLNAWNKNEIGHVWWDKSHAVYKSYYDNKLHPNINDRINTWGSLADWGKVDIFEWVQSSVPPAKWDDLVAAQATDTTIPHSEKATGTARKATFRRSRTRIPFIVSSGAILVSGNSTASDDAKIEDGDTVIFSSTGTLPDGIEASTKYIVNMTSTTTFELLDSDTNENVPITSAGGSDLMYVTKEFTSSDWKKQSVKHVRLPSPFVTVAGNDLSWSVVNLADWEYSPKTLDADLVSIYVDDKLIQSGVPVELNNGLLSVTLDQPLTLTTANVVDIVCLIHTITDAELQFDADILDDGTQTVQWKEDYEYTIQTQTTVNTYGENTTHTYYYFWVQDTTARNEAVNGSLSVKQMAAYLTSIPSPYFIVQKPKDDPAQLSEYKSKDYMLETYEQMPIFYRQMVLQKVAPFVDDDGRYTLQFTRDFTLRDKLDEYHRQNNVKDTHEQWLLFRKEQTSSIERLLWNKLTEALVGYKTDNLGNKTRVPSLERELYDATHNTSTRIGLNEGQSFVDKEMGLNTVVKYLKDPTHNFSPANIDDFFANYSFDTPENIAVAMNVIYDTFGSVHVNRIWFEALHDSMSLNRKYRDLMKTSWIALHGVRVLEVGGLFDD